MVVFTYFTTANLPSGRGPHPTFPEVKFDDKDGMARSRRRDHHRIGRRRGSDGKERYSERPCAGTGAAAGAGVQARSFDADRRKESRTGRRSDMEPGMGPVD